MKIAFVTAEDWPHLTPDDRLAAAEIERRGAEVIPAVWTRAHDWDRFDLVVIRSCWDYHQRIDQFRSWIDELEHARVRVLNPPRTIRWNVDKRYLMDLAAADVDIIETAAPEPDERLSEIMARRGWSRAVLKPRISADGHRTIVIAAADADAHESELQELMMGPGALVQEYVDEIGRSGELSLIFLDDDFSHAVRKTAAPGDFRVQSRFGGKAEPARPDSRLIEQAAEILAAARCDYGYARVDGCVVRGRLKLMELELIEPSLFLDLDADAPARFADLISAAAR